jgi:hypothetical protein
MKLSIEKCSVLHIGVSNPNTNYTRETVTTFPQQNDLEVVLPSTLTERRANFVKTGIDFLEKVQRRATKIVHGAWPA